MPRKYLHTLNLMPKDKNRSLDLMNSVMMALTWTSTLARSVSAPTTLNSKLRITHVVCMTTALNAYCFGLFIRILVLPVTSALDPSGYPNLSTILVYLRLSTCLKARIMDQIFKNSKQRTNLFMVNYTFLTETRSLCTWISAKCKLKGSVRALSVMLILTKFSSLLKMLIMKL